MGNRLYIGNLSWDTTQDTLQAVLTENGRTVKDLHFAMDRETGRPRGFAFAEMANEAEAQQCIEQMDGMELDGRNRSRPTSRTLRGPSRPPIVV